MIFYALDLDCNSPEDWHHSRITVEAPTAAKAAEDLAANSNMDYVDGAKAHFAIAEEKDGSDASVYTVRQSIDVSYNASDGKPLIIPPREDLEAE